MDSAGARLLAARIRAGVRVGARIELLSIGGDGCDLVVGDCGVVDAIADDGDVVVTWDRGFALQIDPEVHRFRRLAAA